MSPKKCGGTRRDNLIQYRDMSTFLKKQFDELGYKTIELMDGILLIENFLKEEELQEFWDIINNTSEDEWFKHYRSHLARFCMEKFGRDDVENLVAEGKYEITKDWDDKNLNVGRYQSTKNINQRINDILKSTGEDLESSFGIFQRMQEGVQLKAHTDQHTDPSIKYAAVIYLNDDYVEGEIFWPKKDISCRPAPGSLLIFPGNEEFEHGVKHVGKGPIRYVMPAFIKIPGFYDNNKY